MRYTSRKYGHNWTMRNASPQYCHYCNGTGEVNEWDSEDKSCKVVKCSDCNGWGILNPEDLKEVD